jgi:hypothetical protein
MKKNAREFGGFHSRARRDDRVGSCSLTIRRDHVRIELLRRFSEILRGRSVFRAAPTGGGIGG